MSEFIFSPIKNEQIMSVSGYFVWCGSMVRTPDNKYHLFLSMWEEKWKFEYGWATHSVIGYAVSDKPDGKFEFKGIIFKGSGKENGWDRDSVHNPNVTWHDGKFYLFYSGNYGNGEYKVHTGNQNIGMAVATDPLGEWTRFDKPLFNPRKGYFDESGTTNPSICKTSDGKFVMVYKAWSHMPPFDGKVSIGIAFADSPSGEWVRRDKPIFDAPGVKFAAEDPCVYSQDGKLFCLLKDMGNFYIPDTERAIIRFESDNGIDWQESDPLLFHTRELDFEKCGKKLIYRMERPFLYIEDNKPRAFFTATLNEYDAPTCVNVHMTVSQK